MKHLSESQKIILNRLFDLIAHDDQLAETIAKEIEIEITELEDLVNNIEF